MSAVLAGPSAGAGEGARRRVGAVVMATSGFAALGDQIVWTQQAALWLGHDTAAVLAVVAAFFGGLAVGAALLGGRIAASRRPAVGYAACEVAVAAWTAVLVVAIAPAGGLMLRAIGAEPTPLRQWTVAFGGTFLLLLPATAAMGATLPAMDRVLGGVRLAALYAANTFGAVAGVLATAFWLVPAIGLTRTAGICVALNLVCAAAAWTLRGDRDAAEPVRAATAPARAALLRLALTGVLGIGYEVLVVRVLSQVAENTVYTFALLLAVYLVGSAGGAALYQRRRAVAAADPATTRDRLVAALAATALVGIASLWGAEALKAAVLGALGPGMAPALAAEAAVAVAAFLPPTLLMGALFSHLASEAGVGLPRALAVNTLGAAFAPLVFGVLLLLAVGPKSALLMVVAGDLALLSPRGWRTPLALAGAATVAALAVLAPPLAFVDVPSGGHVVSYREGAIAAVSVVEDAAGVRRLRIDNRQQEGDSASRVADARQALLPLLLHPAPRQALFLGLGTGVTAAAAAEDASVAVTAVELLPEVVAAADDFRVDGPSPRLHTVVADARRFVRAPGPRVDVVVADNFHPARSGSGALYTVEHFAAVKARLADGGVFCQWLPLHQLDLASLRSIVAAFLHVFPDAAAMLATHSLDTPVLGLVGRVGGTRFDLAAVQGRLAQTAALAHPPAGLGLVDAFAVLGSFVGGPGALQRFAGDAPANTDDHPVVASLAPRLVYAPDSSPRDRLVALTHALGVAPGELVDPGADPATVARLAAYRSARDRFLEAGRGVRQSADVRDMLAQVEAPLLEVLALSADFRPAYDPLLRMAAALAPSDPGAARALLVRLAALQPARSEAPQLLRQLDADGR